MTPRNVIDLLAEQPEETLLAMRESVQAERARLAVEAQQIDQALAKKARRTRGSGNGGRLKAEQVYDVVKRADRPLTAAEVQSLLADEGLSASINAVRNHLARLTDERGLLGRYADGRFGALFSGSEPQSGDADIPF